VHAIRVCLRAHCKPAVAGSGVKNWRAFLKSFQPPAMDGCGTIPVLFRGEHAGSTPLQRGSPSMFIRYDGDPLCTFQPVESCAVASRATFRSPLLLLVEQIPDEGACA
jgi:hypothetical protein